MIFVLFYCFDAHIIMNIKIIYFLLSCQAHFSLRRLMPRHIFIMKDWAWGATFSFLFCFFVENIRRTSVRVLKFHRGFILTKNGDINPLTNLETPPVPLGGVFKFKKINSENFKTSDLTSEGLGEMQTCVPENFR
jgi:hypothetical protein